MFPTNHTQSIGPNRPHDKPTMVAATVDTLPHPFDPLSGEEITRAVDIVKKAHGQLFYQAVTLLEPRKSEMTKWLEDEANAARPARLADVTAIGPDGKVYDAFVDLATTTIIKWEELSDVQPIVRSHQACRNGITWQT